MSKLFTNEDSDSEEELNINKDYAQNYDNWRQKEELNKLKTKYGEEALANSEEESSETSDDDEGEEIPEQFEKSFYKTLACLKNKDPRIYNENVKFFTESDEKNLENGNLSKKKKEKSLFLRDYERKLIVEKGGKLSDTEDEDDKNQNEPQDSTYVQEQQQIIESFKKQWQDVDDQEEFLPKPRNKSKEEVQKVEKSYKEWLKGEKEDISEDEQNDLKPLRDYWINPKLDDSEKYLRDYVLNKKFLDRETTDTDLGYDHIVHDSDENLSEDERNINQQEEFEHKYNFRFEEPDQEFIKRYPRTLENSLRKKDTRRAQKRAEVKARKEQEKVKKREELKELKSFKRKEIEEKIEKLKEITGNDDLQLNMMDLEGDFDPDEYDKKMKQIFNEEYYAGQEDEMKPEFPDIDEELCVESTWDNYDPAAEEIASEEIPYHDVPHCEDPNFNMDAEYDGQKNLETELVDSTKKRRKRRRSKFAEMLAKEKPKFDPSQHPSYKEYYDQYYALDYEDMIGDLPCRFKYREVIPNDYGLSVEEILMADDKELNKWCSLKKALQHKPDYKELNDVKMYRQKAANETLKKKVLRSLYSTHEEASETTPVVNISQNVQQESAKRKRKRKKKTAYNEKVKTEVANNHSDTNVKESLKNNKNTKNLNEPKIEQQDQKLSPTESNSLISEIEQNNNKKKRKVQESLEENNESEVVEKKRKKKKNKVTSDLINKTPVYQPTATIKDNQPSSSNKTKNSVKKLNKFSNGDVFNHETEKNINTSKKKNKINNSKSAVSNKEKRKQKFKQLKNNKEKTKEVDQLASLSEQRLKAYGFNPKKFKNKLKYKKKIIF